jgi:hypothetical protein
LVLSLGTGRHETSYSADDAEKWGVVSWLRHHHDAPLISSLQNASADMVDYKVSTRFEDNSSEDYLRIQVPLQVLICVNTYISHQCLFMGFFLLKLILSLVFAYDPH